MFWEYRQRSANAAVAATRPKRSRRDVSSTPDPLHDPNQNDFSLSCCTRRRVGAGGIGGLWRHGSLLQWTGKQPPAPGVSRQGHCQDRP